jgi:ubiquinone/menaquinone biosynthesis C-methylase UbiE
LVLVVVALPWWRKKLAKYYRYCNMGTNRQNSRRKRKISAVGVGGALAAGHPHRGRMTRKQARKITTQFHRLVQQTTTQQQQMQLDSFTVGSSAAAGTAATTTLSRSMDELEALRVDYQRASQVSTSYFSTSKWVLGCLIQNGWFYGIRVAGNNGDNNNNNEESVQKNAATEEDNDDALLNQQDEGERKKQCRKKKERRPTRILEIGAINTELLDAAATDADDTKNTSSRGGPRLSVRAIDIHSMHEGRIEEADFLTMPLLPDDPFDVVVCSMVLNCVATPADRGRMVQRMFSCLQPNGGVLFLTLPKTCLHLSPFINRPLFEDLLRTVGFDVTVHTKDSPKIAFFVATRTQKEDGSLPPPPDAAPVDPKKWTKLTKIYRGSKYRNSFAVILPEHDEPLTR